MGDKTVYLLGAGFNQFLEDFDEITPPLAKDFFKKALRKRKFKDEVFLEKMGDLFSYIQKFWRYDISELKTNDLDLEEVFTLIQLQIEKYKFQNNKKELKRLVDISFKLEALFSEVLSDFSPVNPRKPEGYLMLIKLGKILLSQQPTIITFNYDTLLEDGMASASGVANPPQSYIQKSRNSSRKLPASLVKYSHANWNPVLAYGFEFDYVSLPQAGVPQMVKRDDYYGEKLNSLYKMKILKLHGSLNWMEVAAPLDNRAWSDENHFSWKEFPAKIHKKEGIIYNNSRWHFGMPPLLGTWLLRPKIITPVLYKDTFYARHPFPNLWEDALIALKQCKRLVVIGYSFPPTDFSTKMLFLEAFSKNSLDELVVVSPDSSGNVKKVVKNLTHFSKQIKWHKSIQDYISGLE